MAKIFTTGNPTVASAALLGETIQNQLRDDLAAHSAWEIVEELTPSTIDWVVMKCLASVSGLPKDFYVVIGRLISTGRLYFMHCEDYNSTTHVMSHYPMYYGTSSPVYNSDGQQSVTFTLASTAPANTVNHPNNSQWLPGATTIKWWIIVGDDHFTMAFNGSPNFFVQVQTYIPLSDLPSDMPVLMNCLTAGGTGPDGGQFRNMALASLTPPNAQGLMLAAGGLPIPSYTDAFGYNNSDFRYGDALNSGKRLLSEIAVNQYSSPSSNIALHGYLHGKHKPHFRYIGQTVPTIAWGDTYSMDGTLWVPYLPTDYRIWDTGVAL